MDEIGVELVDVEYLSERGRWILRIYADREGGITLDDCAMVSREIGDLIDVKDIIPHEYVLEVSSPGLNRPLKKEKDFKRAVGRKIRVKMHAPVEGRRNFTGYLKEFRDGTLHLECIGLSASLPRQDVEKANLVYELDSLKKA
jgi:ribosome maturation factor RimP